MIRRLLALLLVSVCLVQLGEPASKPIELIRPPHIVTDDSPIAFLLRIEPAEANRYFTVAAVDVGYDPPLVARSSGQELPGPITRLIEWDSIPAGEYELLAVLYGPGGKVLARDWQHLEVIEWR